MCITLSARGSTLTPLWTSARGRARAVNGIVVTHWAALGDTVHGERPRAAPLVRDLSLRSPDHSGERFRIDHSHVCPRFDHESRPISSNISSLIQAFQSHYRFQSLDT